jgi:hypothetical protein
MVDIMAYQDHVILSENMRTHIMAMLLQITDIFLMSHGHDSKGKCESKVRYNENIILCFQRTIILYISIEKTI